MVYLDNNATTPLDPAVVQKMSWFLKEHFGNPSSLYPLGQKVKSLITEAREQVAMALGRTEVKLSLPAQAQRVIIWPSWECWRLNLKKKNSSPRP